MRIALFSDIHGNCEALESVLADMGQRNVDRLICLGDTVGYGPESDRAFSILRGLDAVVLAGNHERAMFFDDAYDGMNFQTQENNQFVMGQLSKDNLEYCRSLPTNYIDDHFTCVHGFPANSVTEYLTEKDDDQLEQYFLSTKYPLTFLGHTHRLAGISWQNGELTKIKFQGGQCHQLSGKNIINVGSVGQPREKDRRATYVIYDEDHNSIEIVKVDYDYKTTMTKIKALGFPSAYSGRLQYLESV